MLTKTALAVILFVFCLAPVAVTSGQSRAPITGDWRIEFNKKNADEVQLSMSRGQKQNWSNNIKISEIQGLSPNYANAAADVTLRIVHDAGTLDLVGSFRDGKGAGKFTLTLNDGFFSALAARGYSNLSEEQIFGAAMSDLKISAIDELKAASYDQLTFNNLIESAIFKINAASIADLRSVGFDHLPFNKLVEGSIFKVDSNYVHETESLGFSKLPFEKLVEMRVHKITPEYINQVRQMGFNDLNLDRLVELKIFNVTPEFLNEMRAAGFTSITPKQLVNLRIFKIDGDYVRKAKSEDPNITVEKLVEQKIFEKHPGRGIQ